MGLFQNRNILFNITFASLIYSTVKPFDGAEFMVHTYAKVRVHNRYEEIDSKAKRLNWLGAFSRRAFKSLKYYSGDRIWVYSFGSCKLNFA